MSKSPWDHAKPKTGGGRERSAAAPGRPDRSPQQDADRRADGGPRRDAELRLYGWNACLAAFKRRPQDLRKVYLNASRMTDLRDVLAYCVEQRLGYRLVENDDLSRLTGSQHHEGLCFDVRWPTPLSLTRVLSQAAERCLLVWLDGVGNPHNLGAILRSAAHFGVQAVLSPSAAGVRLSGAAARVAEGGAEAVPLIGVDDLTGAWHLLKAEGFTSVATLPAGANSLFKQALPARTVLVLGAEQAGVGAETLQYCELHLAIPGSGQVESLNVASAAAVFFAEWCRRWG
ncbi:TrmH family RNA methyltransferase [Pseudomarimonas arenosa]|uniref:rRNA methyltransferase n=1 Tax=Pseudomarimonas arenosa TaxID=2774145 RepID=A0AAW3ZGV4_9GAMM|nr:TrmH family RNA methyltransferase [Pseudomarimonas arenosa]MBD8524200.1 rRNA methyltransferase [Pseudomarimonas arenosa]